MAARHKRSQKGGSIKSATPYQGGNSKVAAAAKNTTDAFKCGGKVPGKKSMARLDKRARGGRIGGSPFSSAHISSNGDA